MLKVRTQIEFCRLCLPSNHRINSGIQIFLAIMSSGGITGWALWEDERGKFWWAFLVALSQMINVIIRFFPWEGRVKAIEALIYDLDSLELDMKRRWYDVSEGQLREKEIYDLTQGYKTRRKAIEHIHLLRVDLPSNGRYEKLALERAEQSLNEEYGVEKEE